MFDYDNLRKTVVQGLNKYLNIPIIRSNQANISPSYPYLSYTITMPIKANKGTYGVYADNKERIPVTQVWSLTIQSDNYDETLKLTNRAWEWLSRTGTVYLNDNGVIVQSVTSITNRDNMITVEYEYRQGFDVEFWSFDTIENPNMEFINTIKI